MAQQHRSHNTALSLLLSLAAFASGYRLGVPTPVPAGLRAAQIDIEIRPTATPWSPSEILRRLSGDAGICGWVEGNSSRSLTLRADWLQAVANIIR